MKIQRRGLISNSEARILIGALKQKGCLKFPLDVSESLAVIETFHRARNYGDKYAPNLLERLRANLNYSYASVAMFVLLFDSEQIELSRIVDENGCNKLVVRLIDGTSVDWRKMSEGGIVRWFKIRQVFTKRS